MQKLKISYKGQECSDSLIRDISNLYLDGYSIVDIKEILKINYKVCFITKVLKYFGLNRKNRLAAKNIKKLNSVTESQKQIIYGSLLGDGCLCRKIKINKRKDKSISYFFNTTHSDKQKEYLIHQANVLLVKPHKRIKGLNSWSPNSIYWSLTYYNLLFLEKVYNECIIDGRKTVSKEWLNNLNWEGIAYWFFDDGCSYKNKNCSTVLVEFSTLSFFEYEIDLLISKLLEFGIKSHKVKSIHGNKLVLRLNSESVNLFMDNIEKYATPDVKYKIKRCIIK